MIGYLGEIVFETSDKRICTFAELEQKTSGRWATHDLIGAKPKSEFIGPGLASITFAVNLLGNHGVKPRKELERWQALAETGRPQTLVIGGKPLGADQWVVKAISAAWGVVMNKGELLSAKIEVELEEYAA